jgi:hypothetical protein
MNLHDSAVVSQTPCQKFLHAFPLNGGNDRKNNAGEEVFAQPPP